ncbi:hypothetical protein CACET_c08280 [Clostridium aceticum]|uniref:Uncharacterized protein n=1 Tax=Clostridium aceticum TaxID=84022 RepID=A0A0D8I563_9CLOT|nr:hypothetical protein CACET_c08280 [Clostridium aceticum]KJF25415.1 hypothetical protein TZ02_18835 [Clostridium aceticum]
MFKGLFKKGVGITIIHYTIVVAILGVILKLNYSIVNLLFFICLSVYLLLVNIYFLKEKWHIDSMNNHRFTKKIILVHSNIIACIIASVSFMQTSKTNTIYKLILFLIIVLVFTIINYFSLMGIKNFLLIKFKDKQKQ